MKKSIILFGYCLVLLSIPALAQSQFGIRKANENFSVLKRIKTIDNVDPVVGSQTYNSTVSVKSVLDDPSTMVTTYDLQTNSSCMPRIYRYPDGTIGVTSTWSATTSGSSFPDRGTGYNYFNGNAWGAAPTARIEAGVRTGWPSYAPLGANGEIVISHNVTAGSSLIMSTRTNKGTGTWTVTQPTGLLPPAGATVMAWPRLVTNGNPRTTIHVIAVTEPVANGGTAYQGLDGALLYNKSTDGGATWLGWQLLPGMTSSQYLGISSDAYNWAEPKGDTLAFVVGDNWEDEFIMKSTNNGSSWTKTIIWQCPYDLWPGTSQTDTFYCSDGSSTIALDHTGKAHVAFGRQRALGDATGAKSYFPFTDGLIYWNESMPMLPQSLIEDTLRNHGVWIGYVKDTNVWYQAATQLAYYQVSMSSFPTMVTDQNNYIFVIYSSVTTLLDANSYMLRHLFARPSINDGVSWCDSLVEITNNFFQYHYSECVYPSASPTSTDSLYILFQADLEAGTYLNGLNPGVQGQIDITNNDMTFLKQSKADLLYCPVGIYEKKAKPSMMVYQNVPNPFINQTQVDVELSRGGNLSLEVYSLVGQKVTEINKGNVSAGNYQFTLNASQFTSGVYFYTVRCNGDASTYKMVVE